MDLLEYEKAVLSVMLKFPSGPRRIPQRIVAELGDDKFSSDAHKRIYRAVSELTIEGDVPDVISVSAKLGSSLEGVGGEHYLQSLVGFVGAMGVSDGSGFEQWVRVVDNAGRLRHLGLIIDKYAVMYKDFSKLAQEVSNVDEFIGNLVKEINKAVSGVKSNYKHISIAVEQERRQRRLEKSGVIVDLIPCGWPSLEAFFVPRPATLGIMAGLSSMGKTQFALQLILGVAMDLKENSKPGVVAINELEMQGWRLNRRLACCLAGVDSSALARGSVSPEQEDRYDKMLAYIETLPIYWDDNPNITSAEFSWQSIALHIEHGSRVMGVGDYIELFRDKGDSEELRVSNVVRGHRHVCWETGSCEVLISQYSNAVMMTASKIGGIGKTRYSGAIGHAADWFLEVWNPPQMARSNIEFTIPEGFDSSYAYALVQKNKDHAIGQVPFNWFPEYTRFSDPQLPMGRIYSIPMTHAPKTDF